MMILIMNHNDCNDFNKQFNDYNEHIRLGLGHHGFL